MCDSVCQCPNVSVCVCVGGCVCVWVAGGCVWGGGGGAEKIPTSAFCVSVN